MNRVDIPDFEYDIILEMLRYMYSGKVRQLDALAMQLLAAADKYQLDKLKALCEECLCASLTVDNVCDVVVLSDFHSAEQLRHNCIEFINTHAAEVRRMQMLTLRAALLHSSVKYQTLYALYI